jgi:polyisoprenoid-binding protein YceI
MIHSLVKKILMIFLLAPMVSTAAVPAWTIVPGESSIKFTAIQNNAPVSGEFKKFTGKINVDPEQLSASNVKIIVDVSSVSDPYNQLSDTLKSEDWFNVKSYPQAVFKSTKFSKTGDKTYKANGTLTLRNKTLPIDLTFTQEEYTLNKGRVKGSTTIKRSAFGVGQGEWSDTKTIKDDVRIDFIITAVKHE